MATVICPNCGEPVDTADPLTIYSHHTGKYYHGLCPGRAYATEMTYMGYQPCYTVEAKRRPLLIVTSPRGKA